MNVLVTGGFGFIGSHLVKKLRKYNVFAPGLNELNLQLLDTIDATVKQSNWDVVIHLAAMSHVVDCERNQPLARDINVLGTANLLEALIENKSRCHFIFASTAQVYRAPHGDEVNEGVMFDETRELAPQNFYARTKLEAEGLVAESGLRSTILRLFNHTHRTQSDAFFLPHIFNQLKKGEIQISVGNLDLDRDIGAVSDLVEAFALVIGKANWNHEIFNVCSGYAKNLRRLAELMAEKLDSKAQFILDKSRLRDNEPRVILGSHKKLTSRVGWEPKVLNEQDLVESFLCE